MRKNRILGNGCRVPKLQCSLMRTLEMRLLEVLRNSYPLWLETIWDRLRLRPFEIITESRFHPRLLFASPATDTVSWSAAISACEKALGMHHMMSCATSFCYSLPAFLRVINPTESQYFGESVDLAISVSGSAKFWRGFPAWQFFSVVVKCCHVLQAGQWAQALELLSAMKVA